MTYFGEYTTVFDVRNTFENTIQTGADVLLLDLIRSTSGEIDDIATRKFVPRIETRLYDTPTFALSRAGILYGMAGVNLLNVQGGAVDIPLRFEDDLLEVLSLLNGDGTTIPSSKYFLFPNNLYPKQTLQLKATGGVTWLPSNAGEYIQAITMQAVFGYSDDYVNSWRDTGCTLSAAIVSTSATTFTCTTGLIQAGHLLKIDSEYLYASAVSVGASDTITCVRGVNGSTAATHLNSAPVLRWWQPDIEMLCRQAVVAYHRLKNNPAGETVRIGADSFSTPKDVQAWLTKRLTLLAGNRLIVY